MKSEQKLRDFTLRLIQIIVWFEILWAVVFLAGLVFQWSGLTDQLAAAFFGSGFCAVLVMVALALLNVTANLNIISKTQVLLQNPSMGVGTAHWVAPPLPPNRPSFARHIVAGEDARAPDSLPPFHQKRTIFAHPRH